jgi:hypothetical protein
MVGKSNPRDHREVPPNIKTLMRSMRRSTGLKPRKKKESIRRLRLC